ncbi:GNAT family N-acetyltransferase [Oceanobacillus polygoni]|uniref:Ribosomal-protein-serine acetyltransferase n=1 Tax=Oceanobacillus polygoni TaxID=1235259 RepID=A0A9X0YWL0_9BACI|nr:GNAT family protein [Oceanobacillus polygoni]MBP2078665.1 ribosomal-protein-serine acetyltransferase [Oceanobacillus polygoni]
MFVYEVDEHITLQQLKLQDANQLFQLIDRNRSYLREWLPWLDTNVEPEDSLAFIDHMLQASKDKKGLTAGIFYQDKLVGVAGFNVFDWTNRIGYIGYWIGQDYQGKGIITNVVRALTDYAFTEAQLNRVDIRAAFTNNKSRAIPERLGFKEEGLLRQAEWLYDHYVDHVVYGMLASDWRKN